MSAMCFQTVQPSTAGNDRQVASPAAGRWSRWLTPAVPLGRRGSPASQNGTRLAYQGCKGSRGPVAHGSCEITRKAPVPKRHVSACHHTASLYPPLLWITQCTSRGSIRQAKRRRGLCTLCLTMQRHHGGVASRARAWHGGWPRSPSGGSLIGQHTAPSDTHCQSLLNFLPTLGGSASSRSNPRSIGNLKDRASPCCRASIRANTP